MTTTPSETPAGADDPNLENEMREVLRRMANALISDPDELQARYTEIDEIIAKLTDTEATKRCATS